MTKKKVITKKTEREIIKMRTLSQLKKDYIFNRLIDAETSFRKGMELPDFDDDPEAMKVFVWKIAYMIENYEKIQNHEASLQKSAHEVFLQKMEMEGWSCGPTAIEQKTHHAMIPWKNLPKEYQNEYINISCDIFVACVYFDKLVEDIKESLTS